MAQQPQREPEQSTLTVVLALLANLGVGIAKLIAGLVSGSGALLSEAAHSAGDCSTELLLLTALRRSNRPADARHPFGYGKERFFWSFTAAVAIFISGATFSVYQGLHTLLGNTSKPADAAVLSFAVLGLAFVLEGVSLRQAIRQVRQEAADRRRTLRSYVSHPEDPTVKSVLLEDSAALLGIILAAAGIGLHILTGSAVWDGVASLCIGALLVVAAFLLARTCKELLIGRQADQRLLDMLINDLEAEREVLDVVDILTMMVGADAVLVCVRVDFIDGISATDLERACVRIAAKIKEAHPEVSEVFLEPVPRTDTELRDEVRARYGRVLADDA